MNSIALMVASVTLGVNYGYQPLDNGEMEYIIQLEPSTVKAMLAGEAVFSEIVPEVKGVRRFRIVVGTGKLPRINNKPAAVPQASPKKPMAEFKTPIEIKVPQIVEPPKAPEPPVEIQFEVPEPKIEIPNIPMPKVPDVPQPIGIPKNQQPLNPNRYDETTEIQKPTVIIEPRRLRTPPMQIPPLQQANYTDIKPHSVVEKNLLKPVLPNDDLPPKQPQPAPEKEPESKPWGWLTVTLLGLFISVGANIYQGWIGVGLRGKYHAMVDQLYSLKKKGLGN